MLFLLQLLMHLIQGSEALLLSPIVALGFLIECTLKVFREGGGSVHDKGTYRKSSHLETAWLLVAVE
jgi:hypothetical protein